VCGAVARPRDAARTRAVSGLTLCRSEGARLLRTDIDALCTRTQQTSHDQGPKPPAPKRLAAMDDKTHAHDPQHPCSCMPDAVPPITDSDTDPSAHAHMRRAPPHTTPSHICAAQRLVCHKVAARLVHVRGCCAMLPGRTHTPPPRPTPHSPRALTARAAHARVWRHGGERKAAWCGGGGHGDGHARADVDAPPPPVCGSADGHGAAAHAPSREHARRDRLDRYGGARRQRDLAADVDISPPRSLPLEAPFLLARVDVGQHGRLLGPLGDCRVGGGGGLLLVRRVELARLELLPVVIL
jgi:hypothetical protein